MDQPVDRCPGGQNPHRGTATEVIMMVCHLPCARRGDWVVHIPMGCTYVS